MFQSCCGSGIQRPFLDAVCVMGEVCVVGHGVGLLSVVQVVALGVGELRGDG
jgi:hypothetical protein